MPLDQDTITAQLTLLSTHRRTLTHLIAQAAQYGGEVFAPPATANGIAQARAEIARIKTALRAGEVAVEDELNDQAPPQVEPLPSGRAGSDSIGGDTIAGDTVAGDKVLGNQTTIDTGGGAYIDARGGTIYYPLATTSLTPQERHNRRAMLTKVKTIWVDGLLEHSLAKELRIALDLTEQPDAVELPLNALVQELKHPPRPLPIGTPIIQIFEQMGGTLLILGAPGAGKTTLLLELARDLITRAEQDEGHPIPVVFNLSSWAQKRQPLKTWLAEELNTKYDVPRKLAQTWVDTDVVLPLLDGLDEVAPGHRDACAEAINTYRQDQHGLVPLAVCSRMVDYEALATKLRLQGAVVVQPLTKQQVDAYLEHAGKKLAGVQAARQDDAELGELLETPLMLSIVVLAYNGRSAAEIHTVGTLEERRRHLFNAYIETMFQRRSKVIRYPRNQTLRWLSWLALAMTRQAQTEFLVERLQPDWLSTQKMRLQYVLLDRCIGGLSSGLLVSGLISGLGFSLGNLDIMAGRRFGLFFGLGTLFYGGQPDSETLRQRPIRRMVADALIGWLVFAAIGWLVFGLPRVPTNGLFGLLFALVVGLIGGLLGVLIGKPGISPRQVIIVERLRWVWNKAWRSAVSGLVFGLAAGFVGGLVGGLAFRLEVFRDFGLLVMLVGPQLGLLLDELGFGVAFGLSAGLVGGLGGSLLGGLVGGLSSGPLTTAVRVNQGIRRSVRSALVSCLVGGLIGVLVGGLGFWLVFGLAGGLGGGLLGGLGGGLGGALSFGGYACLSHLALRIVLARNGSLPLRLVPFLDSCTDRIFLRRVGGGYIFVHRMLMEHFASLHDGPPTERTG